LLLVAASAFASACCTWPYRCDAYGHRHWWWHHDRD